MSAYTTAVGHVVAALAGVPDLGAAVFEGVAPTSARYPLIVVQGFGDPATTLTQGGGAPVLTVVELSVRAFSRTPASEGGSIATLVPVAAAIDGALNGSAPATGPDGRIHGCVRTFEQTSTRSEDGAIVRSLGGRWRITVTAGLG